MSMPKITLAVMGMDQHENGAMAVSRICREAQMSVSYLGRFQTPKSITDHVKENPCDVIGISCHSWEYLTLVPNLMDELSRQNLTIPVVIGGSVITAADAKVMQDQGVAAAFGSGASDTEILDALRIHSNSSE